MSKFVFHNIITGKKHFSNSKSISFNGTDATFDIDSLITPLKNTTTGTFSAWIKPTSSTTSLGEMLLTFSQKSTSNERVQFFKNADGKLRANIYAGGTKYWDLETDSAQFTGGKWTHVALVQDGTTPVLYVNGSVPAQTFTTSTNKTKWFNDSSLLDTGRIGSRKLLGNSETYFFDGQMDEISLFNTNLSASEINLLYNSGKPADLSKHPKYSNLVSWFRMGDKTIISSDNYSYTFDGVDEYIDISGVETTLASTTKGTWSFWVNNPTISPSVIPIYLNCGDNTNATERIHVFLNINGTLRANLSTNTSVLWDFSTDTPPFSADTWHHVCLVQDGISPKIYVDGSEPAKTFSISTNKTKWFNDLTLENTSIAGWQRGTLGPAFLFNGKIDEVSFFNTNLNASEVSELYNSGVPLDATTHSKAGNLTNYYKLGDGDTFSTNWTIKDSQGSNNGVSVNMEEADRISGVDPVLTLKDQKSSNNANSINLNSEDIIDDTP